MASDDLKIDIDYVARLARLELTPEEKAAFSGQLEDILGYFGRIREVDVDGVEPMAHTFALENVWQEDVVTEGFTPDEALRNAPAKRSDQLVVPKVVEDA